jgi:hypothetical protein
LDERIDSDHPHCTAPDALDGWLRLVVERFLMKATDFVGLINFAGLILCGVSVFFEIQGRS